VLILILEVCVGRWIFLESLGRVWSPHIGSPHVLAFSLPCKGVSCQFTTVNVRVIRCSASESTLTTVLGPESVVGTWSELAHRLDLPVFAVGDLTGEASASASRVDVILALVWVRVIFAWARDVLVWSRVLSLILEREHVTL
jgi:hypothetical protein